MKPYLIKTERKMNAQSNFSKLFSLTLLTFILSAPNAYAQQQEDTNEDELVGTWVFDYNASRSKIESNRKSKFNALNAQAKAQIRSTYEGRTYQFKSDGSFILKLAAGNQTSGTWELKAQSRQLVLNFSAGTTQTFDIQEHTDSKLRLKVRGDEANTMLFNQMQLNKQ